MHFPEVDVQNLWATLDLALGPEKPLHLALALHAFWAEAKLMPHWIAVFGVWSTLSKRR